ncbi:hypothetical protein HH303_09270 [Rhodospirillaceae bacterium KN72]|uniref:Uncharacterized protein n=1 Tax=Pacificispira spongiicola TaxID=2729598 RepID=A0A7Y0DZW9_9PROT|nr:hypothetical protein [Pacificispira spongiicola]NMM44670.1 hypothetical protein [Pacificispira spongiicola]
MFDCSLPGARNLILSGHRIVPVMQPDATLSASYANPLPQYEESYPLTHIVLVGDIFWGITSGTNQPFVSGKGLWDQGVLGYSNTPEALYISTTYELMSQGLRDGNRKLNLNSLRQYATFRFHARQDAALVWDGERPDEIDALRAAIENGSYFRVVFENSDGVVFSQAVDIAMLFSESGSVEINTHPVLFPDFFLNPEQFARVIAENVPQILGESADRTRSVSLNNTITGGFHSVRSDGTYLGVREILTDRRRQWRQARLYAY